MKRRITHTEFTALTTPLRGLPVSYVWRGYGTTIFIEFGKLHHDPKRNNPKGEFCLDLEWGWRIEKSRSIWFGSDSGDRQISNQLQKLNGAIVKDISVSGRLPEVILNLDDRHWVSSFATSAGQPEWALFLPDSSWCHVINGVLYNEDGKGVDAEEG